MRTHPLSALVLLLSAAVSLPAHSADAEIYGLIDTGFKFSRSSGEDATLALQSGQINGSRVGLRISEKISSDLRIYANLENGFDADTGELGSDGVLFNRNSILGVKTAWGSLEFGRTGALASGTAGGVFAGKVSPFGITWQEAQDTQVLSGSVASRVDNSITYESPSLAGWRIHGQFSNGMEGDDGVKSSSKNRYGALGLSFRRGGFSAVGVVDRVFTRNDFASGKYSGDDYSTYNIGGSYDFGAVKLYAAYQRGDGVTRVGKLVSSVKGSYSAVSEKNRIGYDTDAVVLGADIDVAGGGLKIAAGYAKGDRNYRQWRNAGSLRYKNAQEVEGWQFALGYLYPLSRRTHVYAAAAYVHSDDSNKQTNWSTAGVKGETTQEGAGNEHVRSVLVGIRHRF